MSKAPIPELKSFFRRAIPRLYGRLEEGWTDYKIKRMTKSIVKCRGLIIQAGPFAGMRYVAPATGRTILPKLLGSYETELHSIVEQVIAADHRVVINIGCAEGYYAVGLALRLPNSRVYAFD